MTGAELTVVRVFGADVGYPEKQGPVLSVRSATTEAVRGGGVTARVPSVVLDPTVRRAVADDAGELLVLERDARTSLVDTRGGNRWLDEHPAIGDGWAAVIHERATFVGVITVDDVEVLVGYLVADLDDAPMRIVRVDQVWVEPDARELGFGDEMLATAIAWGRAGGAEIVEGQALPGDRHIKNLYERAGVTARLITVSRRL